MTRDQRPTFVTPLEDASDAGTAGQKASNLARMIHAGIDVPPGIVVRRTALDRLVADNALEPSIQALCSPLHGRSALAVSCAADTVASLIAAAPLPDGLADQIADAVATLGEGPLAVRSSAIGEDSGAASFAGQLDSVLHVRSIDEVIAAVRRVWSSRWSARALAYELTSGVRLAGAAVIVQQQVHAACSGVLFTEDPANASNLRAELCTGLGDQLVSGAITPASVTLSRDGRIQHVDRESGPPPLDDRQARQLVDAGLAIEALFGAPQDVEWARNHDGRLWIVQARPIVKPRSTASVPLERWSNANINENFSGPVTPLLYSIAATGYYHYFRNLGRSFGITRRRLDAMERPLRRIVGVHAARLYYNLTSIHAVLRSAPFGEQLARSFDQFVGAESTDTAAAVPFGRHAGRLRQALELGRVALWTTWQYVFVERRVQRFERTVSAFARNTAPEPLRSADASTLLGHLRSFMDIRCHRWNDAALADAGAMASYGVLQRALTRAFPREDEAALVNSLLKALPDLVSGMPAVELWKLADRVVRDPGLHALMTSSLESAAVLDPLERDPRYAEFRAALQTFQDDWGFRRSGELMLTIPDFGEDPVPLLDILRGYVRATGQSPLAVMAREAADREVQTSRVKQALRSRIAFPGFPQLSQPWLTMRVLGATQACIKLRERARLKQALLYSRLRHVVLALGRRLVSGRTIDTADDLFFLTVDEIDALCSGTAMFPDVRALIALRRREHARLAAQTPPDTLSLPVGTYFSTVPDADPIPAGDEALAGTGACGGRATARAVVLGDVTEAGRLRAGDILVTRQTDPGWGPVFPLLAGLVVERGGMLSHGAIIAREFGIPSVVGVRNATSRVPSGRLVTVDGDRGLVQVLEATA